MTAPVVRDAANLEDVARVGLAVEASARPACAGRDDIDRRIMLSSFWSVLFVALLIAPKAVDGMRVFGRLMGVNDSSAELLLYVG